MQFPLTLTENNARKLVNGHPIQLKAAQLKGNDHYLVLHPATHTRLSKARAQGKGARLALTPQELAASGQGFADLWNKIKKGAQWVKQNVIDTAVYQRAVKPVVREAVQAATAAVAPMLGPAAPLVEQGVQKLGETTGAFGLVMEQPKKPRAKRAKKAAKSAPSGSFLVN